MLCLFREVSERGGVMKEIRIHGRGGQGVVLASEIFVNAAVKEGKHAASFPYFGFERRGAPVFGFVRFDTQPIRQKDQVYHPDCLVVFDHTLFKAVDIYQGIREHGILVLNASEPIPDIPLAPQIEVLGLVDATRISVETVGSFIPNTAMLGALARVTGWVQPRFADKKRARDARPQDTEKEYRDTGKSIR